MTGLVTEKDFDYSPGKFAFFEGVARVKVGESEEDMVKGEEVTKILCEIDDPNHDAVLQGKLTRLTIWNSGEIAMIGTQAGLSKEQILKYGPQDKRTFFAKLVGKNCLVTITAGKPTDDGRVYCNAKMATKEDYEKSVAAGTHYRKVVRPEGPNGKSTTVTATTF